MLAIPTRIFPLGDRALTVEFGNELSDDLNLAAISLAEVLSRSPFPGLIEAVPAIASTTVFYDLTAAAHGDSVTAFENVSSYVLNALETADPNSVVDTRTIEVPVSFSSDDALDLGLIADFAGTSAEAVIEIFLGTEYRVFMLGFLPGFAYMGTVDARIAAPRRASPRIVVPAGSVAVAGLQAGIYPSGSPGGWNIIGRTEIALLTGDDDSPCLFRPGDRVRFFDASA